MKTYELAYWVDFRYIVRYIRAWNDKDARGQAPKKAKKIKARAITAD